MFLKFRAAQVFALHRRYYQMWSNAMVVDFSGSINRLLEITIALVTVELELQGFHAVYCTMSVD